jgi:hypothetical protein
MVVISSLAVAARPPMRSGSHDGTQNSAYGFAATFSPLDREYTFSEGSMTWLRI